MRLREIEVQLRSALKDLSEFKSTQIPNQAIYNINGLVSIRQAVNTVKSLGMFHSEYEALRMTSILGNNFETVNVNSEENSRITNTISKLINNISVVLSSIEVALPKSSPDELTAYVKLPEILDIDEHIEFLQKLKRAIQIPLLIKIDEESDNFKINNFDTGSEWYEIVVGITSSL